MRTRRLLPVFAAATLVFAACGGSDAADDADEAPAEETEETDDTEADADTEDFTEDEGGDVEETDAEEPDVEEPDVEEPEAADTTPPATDGAVDDPAESDDSEVGDAAAGSRTPVSLVEWAIEAPTECEAGEITFSVTNNGGFPHELVVIEGESYESLPLAEGGAVVEDDLPTGALIGRTERFGGGSERELTVTLAPGNYVLVCNVGGGATSHAGQGQRLDITVN